MTFTVSKELLERTTHPYFERHRRVAEGMSDGREFGIDMGKADGEALADLAAAAAAEDGKTARAIESVLQARAGDFNRQIPSFKAFSSVLDAFLKSDLIDGWIYVTDSDENVYPELATEIRYSSGKEYGASDTPTVTLVTACYGLHSAKGDNSGVSIRGVRRRHVFTPSMVSRRRIADILSSNGILKESADLKAQHERSMGRHRGLMLGSFAKQFRMSGKAYSFCSGNENDDATGYDSRRVIHDTSSSVFGPLETDTDSFVFETAHAKDGIGRIPEHPLIRVFDLQTHEFVWTHSDYLTPYQYDSSLKEKLVLPATHRDLLDVLTRDISVFTQDIIEGKSAGNVILCKGIPGVGKTLTAEVYAELTEKPLYSVHSGSLGTTAKEIGENLKTVFNRCRRWQCILLLDEADVFVVRRAGSIEQNAIVAEFLRALEYFDGLMFMTTNRPDDIDEAIISRCAAIIQYGTPTASDARAIWKVMADQFRVDMPNGLIDEAVALFPKIAPRDIKMLLRLAIRVSISKGEAVSLGTLRQCAMFRAIEMAA